MMSRHFALNSELTGAIAKRLPHAKNQLSVPGSFFNQFVTDIDIYTNNNRVLIVRIIESLNSITYSYLENYQPLTLCVTNPHHI